MLRRWDAGIEIGDEVTLHYDSLLAKVIAHGATREEAIRRMDSALGETRIGGVHTTADLCRSVMRDERFIRGGVPIDFLQTFAAPATSGS